MTEVTKPALLHTSDCVKRLLAAIDDLEAEGAPMFVIMPSLTGPWRKWRPGP